MACGIIIMKYDVGDAFFINAQYSVKFDSYFVRSISVGYCLSQCIPQFSEGYETGALYSV